MCVLGKRAGGAGNPPEKVSGKQRTRFKLIGWTLLKKNKLNRSVLICKWVKYPTPLGPALLTVNLILGKP